jgi:vacuolar-type H+-ATPase subunit E/Vma4
MPDSATNSQLAYSRILKKARDLAEQLRETAERVHQQALETHRLTKIARLESERGRELSRAGRQGARAVLGSIKSSLDTSRKAGRPLWDKNKD